MILKLKRGWDWFPRTLPFIITYLLFSVKKLRDMNITVVYTSHYMEEVEAVCSRVGIMDNGKLVACGSKSELKSMVHSDEKLVIKLSGINYSSIERIKQISAVKEASIADDILTIYLKDSNMYLQDILIALSGSSVKIHSIDIVETDLETVFLSLTGRKLRD